MLMRQFLREPLLHFLLLAVAVFAVYDVAGKSAAGQRARIVVTQGQIASMVEGFTRTWQRPPTTDELEGLIRDRVREEVYWREAVALGLDKEDPIIRRRLRQKLEFVTDDVAAQAEPTDGELSAYLKTHADAFRVERRFTFRQVYLDPERHGENLGRDAAQLLARLNQVDSGTDVLGLGDPFLLEHDFDAVPAGEVDKQFGEKFAAKLGDLPLGQWQGPVESGYGVHLVFVGERTEERVPELPEVRDAVRREWLNDRRRQANEKFYEEALKRYAVVVEPPQPAAPVSNLAAAKTK